MSENLFLFLGHMALRWWNAKCQLLIDYEICLFMGGLLGLLKGVAIGFWLGEKLAAGDSTQLKS